MGIAGSGMSALARIMLARGLRGDRLREPGVGHRRRAARSWAPRSRSGTRSTTWTTSTRWSTPPRSTRTTSSWSAARERGLRVLRRATALAAMITGSRAVAIAGTHGKTTTTSLLTVAAQAGRPGSVLRDRGEPARHRHQRPRRQRRAVHRRGRRERRLVPAAAARSWRWSPTSRPTTWRTTATWQGVFRAFEQFVDRIAPGGLLLCCADDAGARRIAEYARARGVRVRSYGEPAGRRRPGRRHRRARRRGRVHRARRWPRQPLTAAGRLADRRGTWRSTRPPRWRCCAELGADPTAAIAGLAGLRRGGTAGSSSAARRRGAGV